MEPNSRQDTIPVELQILSGLCILGILTLAATQGTPIMLRITGLDEQDAFDALAALINDKFGEKE